MFNHKRRRIADLTEDLAELRIKYAAACKQVTDKTAECQSWDWLNAAAERQATALIARTREVEALKAELKQTRDDLADVRRRIAAITQRKTAPAEATS